MTENERKKEDAQAVKDEKTDDAIRLKRARNYPPIGDQLDALWKDFEARKKKGAVNPEAAAILAKIKNVKQRFPKFVKVEEPADDTTKPNN